MRIRDNRPIAKVGEVNPTRRSFLRTAPLAAAAGLSVGSGRVFAAEPANTEAETAQKFQVFTAAALEADAKALEAAPGNNTLVTANNFTVVLTTETGKSAKEFEWHEGRDHVVQIVDGATVYEVGGTPRSGRKTKPGEWLAPESEGATKLTLKKGDMLTVPRGTPHRRSTAGSVTFLLISPMGTVAG